MPYWEVVRWVSFPSSWSWQKSFQFFPVHRDAGCGFVIRRPLLQWGGFLLFRVCWVFSSWCGVESLQIFFLHLVRWSWDFHPLLCWLFYGEPSLHPRDWILLACGVWCWIGFPSVVWGRLHLFSSRDFGLVFL